MRRFFRARQISAGALIGAGLVIPSPTWAQEGQRGPAIVSRDPCQPSIHEGFSGRQSAGFRRVEPFLGILPASYDWFGGILRAIGSAIQPFAADPTYLGQKSGQQPFFFSRRGGVSRTYAGYKGIGGRNVTDVPRLGQPGGPCPGDPFWVGFPRPGNIEFPPPFQTLHYGWDCFCRFDELIACPTGSPPPLGLPIDLNGPNLHRSFGGSADFIPCAQCFGLHNIRKHDRFVGTPQGPHRGYPNALASDPGYQECLRQSVESFAGSGPGGAPQVPHLYGF